MDIDTPDTTPTGVDSLVGRVLGDRYRIENVVAAGANTVITEAIDTEGNRPVTVKIVRPELAVTSAFRQAFRRQVEVAMSLNHPNIASVLGWGETELDGESTLFWVIEYLGGGSLRDLFDRGRLLDPSQALVVGLEAARALEAAHSRGIVHTELTPSKLVFGEDARLRIADVAMAQLLGAEAWSEPATVATHVARYASPEQALGLDVDEKTDVYALSLCLIESITGKVPFAGDSTVSTLAARVGKLMPVTAEMGSLASVLERGGRPDSDDRWTAAEFAKALVSAAETLPRPEPIPVLATSLFASSLSHRVEPTPPSTPQEDPAPAPPPASAPDPEPASQDDDAAPVLPDAAAPLLLLTDVADPPTGAVQVASESDPGTAVEPGGTDMAPPAAPTGPTGTAVMPAVAPAAVGAAGAAPTVGRGAAPVEPPPTGPRGPAVRPAGAPAAVGATGAEPTVEMAAASVEPQPSGVLYDEERPKRSWGKSAVIALVVLLGIGLLGYAGWLLLRTKSYEVPDLTGVEESVALNEIAGNGWVIETERERSDEVPEIDHVVRTVPVAGEMLDEGETFLIVVSDGYELRTLPELAGMTLTDAVDALSELRLVPVEAPAEYSEEVPAGSVIRWQVQGDAALTAGAQVLPDTAIVITASLGPEPRPAPNLVNLTAAEATAALDALQLVSAQGEDVFSNDVEVGRVVTQNPPPDTPVERGGTVTFQLSKGPDLVAFPDLTGLTYPEAQTVLAGAGYAIDSLLGTTAGVFVSASVDGTEVQAGAMFPRDTGVDLIFL